MDEARNINWQDIDFDREIIHLKTAKGDRERVIFLHKKLVDALGMYGTKEDRQIFVSREGERYNKNSPLAPIHGLKPVVFTVLAQMASF